MKYVALLRGINVGGNAKVAMKDLIKLFSGHGYTNVKTYINSGNVVFETKDNGETKIQAEIEEMLLDKYGFEIRVVVLNSDQLKSVMKDIPNTWNTDEDIRKYIAFVRLPKTPAEVVTYMKPRDGVDMVATGHGVIYMTTLTEGLTKSGFTKLIGTPIYKDITIRNFRTCQKLFEMMK